MQVVALKTPIIKVKQRLRPIITATIRDRLPDALPERSVVVITSKIIAYEQGRLVPIDLSAQSSHSFTRFSSISCCRHSFRWHLENEVVKPRH